MVPLLDIIQTNIEDAFEVYQEPCPGGYVLSNLHDVEGEYECVCNINDNNILFCNEGVVVFKVSTQVNHESACSEEDISNI